MSSNTFLHLRQGNPIAADTNLDGTKLTYHQNYLVGTAKISKVVDKDGQVMTPDQEITVNSMVTLVPYIVHGENVIAVKRGLIDMHPDLSLKDKFVIDWPTRLRASQQFALTGKAKKKIKVGDLMDAPLVDLYMYF